ncbi:MAG: transposase [Thermodesulfobacteriota bacterium]|nr:transposase [Thermodesulfobacteriota bacterium]
MGQKLKTGDILWDETTGIKKRFVKQLKNICKKPLVFKPAETLRAYLYGPEQKSLFTFLGHHGVPPTNNHAEQSLRHLVIFRKICFGNRSQTGLKTHGVLSSLVQTARRQNVHPRQFLQILPADDKGFDLVLNPNHLCLILVLTESKFDGLVKSPFAALRGILRHCGVAMEIVHRSP